MSESFEEITTVGGPRSGPLDHAVEQSDQRDPLARLYRFHSEIRRALADLKQLAGSRELAARERRSARVLVDFFTGPFVDHDLAEETSLLPRLRVRTTRPEHQEALRLVTEDHDKMEDALEKIVPTLKGIDDGSLLKLRSLDGLVRTFVQIVEPHLVMEERQLFPLARACLDSGDLSAMTAELDERERQRARGQSAAVRIIGVKEGLRDD